jgi:hypothetical protein
MTSCSTASKLMAQQDVDSTCGPAAIRILQRVVAMPDDPLLVPIIINQGQYPLYDVAVSFAELRHGKLFDIGSAARSYPVGNIAPGLSTMPGIRLPHHGKDIEFNIIFTARNGMWIENAVGWRRLGEGDQGETRNAGTP